MMGSVQFFGQARGKSTPSVSAAAQLKETAEPLTGHAWALRVLSGFTGLGLVLSMTCAGFSIPARWVPATMTAALISGASFAVGGFLGFLFGIPRTPPGGETPANGDQRLPYLPNTNLEQISDWLTKILVGVGLTQIASLPIKLDALAEYGASCFGDSKAMSLAVLVYFSVAGFLIGFLWTRLYLPRALRDADVLETLKATQKAVDEMQRAKENEQQVLTLIERQLNKDFPPVSPDELSNAISSASSTERTLIFYRAARVRTATWRDQDTKPDMERTIPIFRALIQANPDYYRTHGQLGFALKDSREPQWEEAERELTTAIELRGKLETQDGLDEDWTDRSAPWYEYVRAQCRINLDADFAVGKPSTSPKREQILADITAALPLGHVVINDEHIQRWVKLNNVNLVTLGGTGRG